MYGKTRWCHRDEQTYLGWPCFDGAVGWDDLQMFIADEGFPWLQALSDTYVYSLFVFPSKYCSSSLNIYYYVNQDTTPHIVLKNIVGDWLQIQSIVKLCSSGLNENPSLKGDPRTILILWSWLPAAIWSTAAAALRHPPTLRHRYCYSLFSASMLQVRHRHHHLIRTRAGQLQFCLYCPTAFIVQIFFLIVLFCPRIFRYY